MEKSVIRMIKSQTNVRDFQKIRETYYKCNKNVELTILTLMEIDTMKTEHKNVRKKNETQFDEMRMILDAKDTIFSIKRDLQNIG